MAIKYNFEVLHNGMDCGGLCIFQTSDKQMDSILPLAWSSKAVQPGKPFDWKLEYEVFYDADSVALDSVFQWTAPL